MELLKGYKPDGFDKLVEKGLKEDSILSKIDISKLVEKETKDDTALININKIDASKLAENFKQVALATDGNKFISDGC